MRELKGKTMNKGKRYKDAINRYDRERLHGADEALELVKSLATAKFDETVELVLRLGIDPRKADEALRGTVGLPAGTGRTVRIAVFAQGEAAMAARDAGADFVGAEDLAEQVQGGMMDFDVVIASPDMMPVVGRLGRVLGPRGLMPNPKTGTVTPDVAKAVGEFKGGRVEYRADKNANVAVPIGKVSFSTEDLMSNLNALIDELERVKPAGSKGRYIRRASLSSTMGPGVKLDHYKLATVV